MTLKGVHSSSVMSHYQTYFLISLHRRLIRSFVTSCCELWEKKEGVRGVKVGRIKNILGFNLMNFNVI